MRLLGPRFIVAFYGYELHTECCASLLQEQTCEARYFKTFTASVNLHTHGMYTAGFAIYVTFLHAYCSV